MSHCRCPFREPSYALRGNEMTFPMVAAAPVHVSGPPDLIRTLSRSTLLTNTDSATEFSSSDKGCVPKRRGEKTNMKTAEKNPPTFKMYRNARTMIIYAIKVSIPYFHPSSYPFLIKKSAHLEMGGVCCADAHVRED